MLEKDVEARLKREVESMGCLCLKWVSPGYVGVPDRIVLIPGGHVAFVETKAPGKRARPRQEYVHGLLRKLGFTVFPAVANDTDIQLVVNYCRLLTERL